ncbi:DJ-1/PfpI family protein [Methanothrix soehngenii]|uniref:DJ-1/PfpI family protein n=1 Tax=Methanothrix soehngenii TaxID=2223 RepID=UPI00300C475E
MGFAFSPTWLLNELSQRDSAIFILPGGIAWDEGKNKEAIEVARVFLDSGVPVAAICGATAGLARGGLLDCRRHL